MNDSDQSPQSGRSNRPTGGDRTIRRFGSPEATTRPDAVFDPGLQHERTSLAWERTAVSSIVAGVLLARFSAQSGHLLIGVFSLIVVVYGSFVLVWAAVHYEDLHSRLRAGESPAHPQMGRFVGMATVAMTALALAIVLLVLWEGER